MAWKNESAGASNQRSRKFTTREDARSMRYWQDWRRRDGL